MGFYYSEDGRTCTSTISCPPTTFLTQKGLRDTDAAITIQRWWRQHKQQSYLYSDELFRGIRLRHKRKHEDTDSDIVEVSDSDLESNFDIEEINSSEFAETESDIEGELQTVANNNFLWDLWFSFYNFLWKLLSF